MKKLLFIVFCSLIIFNIVLPKNIQAKTNDTYIEPTSMYTKGNYAYRQKTFTSLQGLNQSYLSKIPLNKNEELSHFIVYELYDCKKYRYKFYKSKLYTNLGRVVSEETDNKWYYDLPKKEIEKRCITCMEFDAINKRYK